METDYINRVVVVHSCLIATVGRSVWGDHNQAAMNPYLAVIQDV
jgi:hypothetical protein